MHLLGFGVITWESSAILNISYRKLQFEPESLTNANTLY